MRPSPGLLVAALLAVTRPGQAEQTAIFPASTEVVHVDVMVTAGRRLVTGLTAADFVVEDSGVRQKVELASFEPVPLSVVLALDVSDSVAGERLQHLRAAGRAVLEALHPGDRVALVSFSDAVSLEVPLGADPRRLQLALDKTWAGGNTALVDGAYAAILLGEAGPGRALVIVFSDGVDTASCLRPEAVLDVAKRTDAVVYGVTLRGPASPEFLEAVTHQTGGRRFEVESTGDLGAAFARVLAEFRDRYVIGFTPSGVPGSGWHPLTVRVKSPRAKVRARPGYLANGG